MRVRSNSFSDGETIPDVRGDLTGANVKAPLADHLLAEASTTGTYSLNLRLQPRKRNAAWPEASAEDVGGRIH
jgi:hypothetical protein